MNIPAILRKISAAMLILLWLSQVAISLVPADSPDHFGEQKLESPNPVRTWDAVKLPEHSEYPLSHKLSFYSISSSRPPDRFTLQSETKRASNRKTNVKLFKLKHAFLI